jgi:hypothetical protein
MAMYLYKMLNVLQTCPYKFLHISKLKCFKCVCPMNLDFFGGRYPNTKIGICVKTTLKPTCFLSIFKWNEFIKCFYNSYYHQFWIVVFSFWYPLWIVNLWVY